MTAIIILVAGTVLNFFANAGSLWFFSKLFKFPRRSFARAAAITLVTFIFSIALALPQIFLQDGTRIVYLLVAFPLQLMLWCLVIRRGYRTTFIRGSAGVGMIFLSQILILAFTLVVIRPYLIESYILPTSGMAPTLRGPYHVVKCPNCGGELVVPILNPRLGYVPTTEVGICADCLRAQVVRTSELTGSVMPADHFLVTRILSPRRWDLLTFRSQGDVYVKRLVALPNETVSIDDDGGIFINGTSIGPPPDAPKLRFVWPENPYSLGVGKPLHPNASLRLGPDDYFVVGDNSMESLDSRFFGPVHKADIVGVATFLYWPFDRMKIIR
jgi:signal peptidase I